MRLLLFYAHFCLLFQPSWWTLLQHLTPFSSSSISTSVILVEAAKNVVKPGNSNLRKFSPPQSQKSTTEKVSWWKRQWNKLFHDPFKGKPTTSTSARTTTSVNSVHQWRLKLFGKTVTIRRPLWWLAILAAGVVVLVLLYKIFQFLFFDDENDDEEEEWEEEEEDNEGGKQHQQQSRFGYALISRRGRKGLFRLLSTVTSPMTTTSTNSKLAINSQAMRGGKGSSLAGGGLSSATPTTTSSTFGRSRQQQQAIKSVVSEPAVKLPSGSEIGLLQALPMSSGGNVAFNHQHNLLLKPVVKSPSDGGGEQSTNLMAGGSPSITPPTTTTTSSSSFSGKGQHRHFSNTPMGSMAGQGSATF